MENKLALIVGIDGQDGKLLCELLKKDNYKIVGISSDRNYYYGINSSTEWTNILLEDEVSHLIDVYKPDEIYYLAAYHHSSQDELPDDKILYANSHNIHVLGYFNILNAIKNIGIKSKILYASSCLIYEGSNVKIQDENTLPKPLSPYSITKLEGMHIGDWFSNKYGLNVVNAILYNHESEYRPEKFVSMKIVKSAINISRGLQDKLEIGDISKKVDWGYAGDYVDAMHKLLLNNCNGNFIISSGTLHSIEELIELAFGYFNLDYKKYIGKTAQLSRNTKTILYGNNSKLCGAIGRFPKIKFCDMIYKMIECKNF